MTPVSNNSIIRIEFNDLNLFFGKRVLLNSQVKFELEGCINTNACCNALANLAEGKTVEQSWEIFPNEIIGFLETLPTDHHHCAELTVGTFYLALADSNAASDSLEGESG